MEGRYIYALFHKPNRTQKSNKSRKHQTNYSTNKSLNKQAYRQPPKTSVLCFKHVETKQTQPIIPYKFPYFTFLHIMLLLVKRFSECASSIAHA